MTHVHGPVALTHEFRELMMRWTKTCESESIQFYCTLVAKCMEDCWFGKGGVWANQPIHLFLVGLLKLLAAKEPMYKLVRPRWKGGGLGFREIANPFTFTLVITISCVSLLGDMQSYNSLMRMSYVIKRSYLCFYNVWTPYWTFIRKNWTLE